MNAIRRAEPIRHGKRGRFAGRRGRECDRSGRERGQASIELLGVLPILLLIAVVGIQLGIVAYAASQASTAARTAARTASQDLPGSDPQGAGTAAVADWLQDDLSLSVTVDDEDVSATARISIPALVPGMKSIGTINRTAHMPKE
ncbi:TadE/TadG family type IV pilus assembly protein [Wenjunlia tyrosinilytica]|uniref:TadE-like domain-containing protein n=1 Tax=Wenjunlia tyrosinilytica TaxID=1544741 RepID=A0A918E1V5_9ACTN|nr:TadE/TadG family type IV pilus assembly protein [Wenjunlia tyrosinilytica]GGO97534.1 hypothetical protein GCM10012280_59560 [Wenjunlia tyrosinilytica]